jgi:hypothetical protein
MSKVRVPKEHRPPTRFGIIVGKSGMEERRKFRVKSYRNPRIGETFWGAFAQDVTTSFCGGLSFPRVILEEIK